MKSIDGTVVDGSEQCRHELEVLAPCTSNRSSIGCHTLRGSVRPSVMGVPFCFRNDRNSPLRLARKEDVNGPQ